MRFLRLFPLLSLHSFVSALPVLEAQEAAKFRYPWKDFTLSNLESVCRKQDGDQRYTCNLKFDVYDFNTEDVVEVSGAHCGAAWQWDGITPNQGPDNNYPSNGVLCWSAGSDAFQFRVAKFRSASNFELYINHFYRDTRYFKPPYDGRKALVNIVIPDAHPLPPVAPYVPPVNQFEFIATATISRRTDGLS
ncbi:hypothetical protein HER10_EVM0009203 [Colletotrichum scovillei]|uniref:Uncharacterized protein n=1 Tax=Colletotrichum scovillei TaxID=1209932 RepID=A0A9P7R6X6_9PEZI|nr:uncharacterized protein HER10_EVM0009203 [Colletotrichum scovillei]KAF4783363.1 hypothetical protein HER10_EVM0009203 [Colletotrichum scovillei]KAG7051312.1 hypothetical protein JMJ77_0001936 [Colletotrichum scovillei]KAG7070349.1 hypothetical protein JMJ76_0001602 [Colletotrichum scovillei]KAG7078597.1 hypothetical protein JMJ78_0002267 [Colletotrichum scovillei]